MIKKGPQTSKLFPPKETIAILQNNWIIYSFPKKMLGKSPEKEMVQYKKTEKE